VKAVDDKGKKSPTYIVVGGTIGVALGIVAFSVAGWKAGLLLSAYLAYEAWTFFNKYKNDTISEVVWEFAERPLVPWMFGVGTGWAIQSGFISDPWLIGSLLFLQGHFFFQAHKKRNGKKEE
jgi:hypothetical protein